MSQTSLSLDRPVQMDESILNQGRPVASSHFLELTHRFLRNRTATFGAAMLVAIILVALAADVLSPYPANVMHPEDRLFAPGAKYWLGTDEYGRDILTRVIHG